jgi:hypothetical protein
VNYNEDTKIRLQIKLFFLVDNLLSATSTFENEKESMQKLEYFLLILEQDIRKKSIKAIKTVQNFRRIFIRTIPRRDYTVHI